MKDERKNEGFCRMHFESTLDGASRIRLNQEIIRIFDANHVERVWLYPSPVFKAIILCPESMRDRYLKFVKQHYPQHMDPLIAYRKFVCSCRSGVWDKQNRMYVPAFAHEHAGIIKESSVYIIGAEFWYEVWDYNTWQDVSGLAKKSPQEISKVLQNSEKISK